MAKFDMETALDRAWAEPASTLAILLARAEELFAQRGFEGVTIRDIAGAAGVNVSTLHFHWKDKLTLFEAVCRNHDRYFWDFLRRMNREAEQRPLGLDEEIERYVDWSVDFLVEHPSVARITLQYLSEGGPLARSRSFMFHNVGTYRLVAGEIERRLAPEAKSRVDPMLLIFLVFFGGAAVFADSPLQRELLGGSVYENPEIQKRVKRYGRELLRQLLGA